MGVSSYEQLLKSRTRRWTNYRNDELLRPQMDEISELAILQSLAVFSLFLHRQQWFYPFIPLCEQPPNMANSRQRGGVQQPNSGWWFKPSSLKIWVRQLGWFFHISQLGWSIIPNRWKVIKFHGSKAPTFGLWSILRMLHLKRGFFGWTNVADNCFCAPTQLVGRNEACVHIVPATWAWELGASTNK